MFVIFLLTFISSFANSRGKRWPPQENSIYCLSAKRTGEDIQPVSVHYTLQTWDIIPKSWDIWGSHSGRSWNVNLFNSPDQYHYIYYINIDDLGWIRSHDLRVTSAMLFQLSYQGLMGTFKCHLVTRSVVTGLKDSLQASQAQCENQLRVVPYYVISKWL